MAHAKEHPDTLSEVGFSHHARPAGAVGTQWLVCVPTAGVADAPEPPAAGRLHGLQHRGHGSAQVEVRVANYSGSHFGRAVLPAVALSAETTDPLDLTDGLHLHRTRRPVHGIDLNEQGLQNVMPCGEVAGDLVDHVTVSGFVPEMVVGVADGQTWIQSVFRGLL